MINEKIFACPKCGQIPLVIRSEDPSEIDKRYSIVCNSNNCKINRMVYGPTKSIAINKWNIFAAKIICPKTDSEGIVRS